MQVKMERPQFAAIVPRGDAEHSRDTGCPHPRTRRFFDRGQIKPINNNLVDRVGSFG